MSNLIIPSFVFPPSAPGALDSYSRSYRMEDYVTAAIKVHNSTLDFGNPPQLFTTTNSSYEAVAAHDIVEIRWTEPKYSKWPVTAISIFCLSCSEDSTQALGDKKWESCCNFMQHNVTTAITSRKPGVPKIDFEIPEVNSNVYKSNENRQREDLIIISVCTFCLRSATAPPSYDTYPAASQVFMVNNRPRKSMLRYTIAPRYRYSATGRQMITDANNTRIRTPRHTNTINQNQRGESKLVAAILGAGGVFAVIVLILCYSVKRTQTNATLAASDATAQRSSSIIPMQNRGAEASPAQVVPKPPPAYHEVVTDQETMLAQYTVQHANAPVPGYTQREGPTSPV